MKSAILVIDMVNDILKPEGRYSSTTHLHGAAAADRVILPLRRFLNKARKIGVPVIYTVHSFRPGYIDASPRSPARKLGALVRGSKGAEVIDELKPHRGEFVVEKHRPSAFYNTDLDIILRGLGVKQLIFTGGFTNIAVMATVSDAYSRDFQILVLSDCTLAADNELHLATLKSIREFFGAVSDSKRAIDLLRKD